MSRIARNRGKATKSIYSKIKAPEPQAVPILLHGSRISHQLYGAAELVQNPRLERVKSTISSLKLSAGKAGAYGLNCNQIGINSNMMTLYNQIEDNKWFTDESVEMVMALGYS